MSCDRCRCGSADHRPAGDSVLAGVLLFFALLGAAALAAVLAPPTAARVFAPWR